MHRTMCHKRRQYACKMCHNLFTTMHIWREEEEHQIFTSHIKRELSLSSGLRQVQAIKHLGLRYSMVMGLGQTVFRASASFSLVIIPHDFGIADTAMNQKARRISLFFFVQ